MNDWNKSNAKDITEKLLHLSKEVLFKKELQLFNRVNIPIQNLLIRARGGTALIQSLLCYRVTLGQNS